MKITKKTSFQIKDGRWITELQGDSKYLKVTGIGASAILSELNAQTNWNNILKETLKTNSEIII